MPRKSTMSKGASGTGSIRKNTTTRNGKQYTYWQARYTVGYDPGTGKQIQRSITAKTQKEVTQKLKQATCEIDQGIYLAPIKLTVEEWLNIWVKDYLEDVKASTKYLYMRNVEQYIIPHLGAVKLEALTSPMVQALYNTLWTSIFWWKTAIRTRSHKHKVFIHFQTRQTDERGT